MDDIQEKSRLSKYMDQIPWIGEFLNPTDKVAVIRMAGVIADSSQMRRAGINAHKFRDSIDQAFDLPRTKAVAIIINSPGGAPAQCSILSSMIQKLSNEKNIPVYTFVEDVAASGGYWLACLGDEIYAQSTSIVGSIGVISASFGFDEFIKKHHVERRIHTSGRDKSFLDPFKPEKAYDVSRLKSLQADMHETFKDWVRAQRGMRLKGDDADLMEGGFWTGNAALELGLIDGIGDITSVMKEKFGSDIKFVDCSPEKKSWLSSLLPIGDARIDIGDVFDKSQESSIWARFGL
jgi:signal peptide peptidase SppA